MLGGNLGSLLYGDVSVVIPRHPEGTDNREVPALLQNKEISSIVVSHIKDLGKYMV